MTLYIPITPATDGQAAYDLQRSFQITHWRAGIRRLEGHAQNRPTWCEDSKITSKQTVFKIRESCVSLSAKNGDVVAVCVQNLTLPQAV
jgi:hypothetical protein